MKRPSPRFSGAAVAVAALFAAACASRSGFLNVPGGEIVGSTRLARAASSSIPLIHNSGKKSGFHVQLSIAGTKIRSFLFDTGSTGLWVYANTIAHPKDPVRDLHIEAKNTYGSGLQYEGEAVQTTVNFGDGKAVKNLPLVRVEKASCVTSSCIKTYGTGNVIPRLEKDRGLWGTFGADIQPRPISEGTHKSDLYNALFGLGSPWTRFAVTPADIQAGPSLRGFTTLAMQPGPKTNAPLPNGAKSWMRDVLVCYTISGSSPIYSGCILTLFDTGADGVTFRTTSAALIPTQPTKHCGQILTPGKKFSANGSGTHDKLLAEFTAGVKQNWNEVKIATPKPSASPEVNTGLTFYNRNEIVFDAVRGLVGLRPLDPPVHNFQTDCDGETP